MQNHYNNFKKIIGKKFSFFFIILVISIIFCSFLETLGIGLIIPIIKIIFSEEEVGNIFINQIEVIEGIKINVFIVFSSVLLFFLAKNLYLFFNLWLQNKFYSDYSNYLSDLVLKKYLVRELLFFKNNNSSIILRNILNETKQISRNYLKAVVDLFSETILFIFILIFLILFDPIISLVLIFVCVVFSIIYLSYSKKKILNLGKERAIVDGSKIKIVQETIYGIDQLKISNRENFFLKIFNFFNIKSNFNILKQNLIAGIPKLSLEVLVILFIIVFISISLKNNISVQNLILKIGVLVAISIKVMPSISKFLVAIQTFRYSKESLSIIFEIIDYKQSVEYSNEKYDYLNKITFKNIKFKYPDKKDFIINDLNLEINKGKILGIYGPSGCGKSTLGLLMTSLIKPDVGEILVNNKKLNFLSSNWLSRIGYVSQSTFVMTDNLYKNIAFGINENLIDYKKVENILEFLNLSNLKKELDINGGIIQEFGKDISGGQKQRIGIARALYFNPDVIILDEATSSLDPENEKIILEKMQELKNDKIILIISHNHKVLNFCDEIYNFETNNFDKR